jgi:hypothetical protein
LLPDAQTDCAEPHDRDTHARSLPLTADGRGPITGGPGGLVARVSFRRLVGFQLLLGQLAPSSPPGGRATTSPETNDGGGDTRGTDGQKRPAQHPHLPEPRRLPDVPGGGLLP